MTFGLRLLAVVAAFVSVVFYGVMSLQQVGSLPHTAATLVWLVSGLTACFVTPHAFSRRF